ncbi:MAG: hypothetical protein ABEI58_00050 [Candidatus Nanohaloarchaea archaeon]
MVDKKTLQVKYAGFFLAALTFGFLTYQAFGILNAKGALNQLTVLLNTVVVLVSWFFIFTGEAEFVKRNLWIVVLVPLLSVYVTDIYYVWSSPFIQMKNFLLFVFVSSLLFYTSFRASQVEDQLMGRS